MLAEINCTISITKIFSFKIISECDNVLNVT